MRREVTWVEKLPGRIKREVRVQIHGGNLYFRETFSDREGWNESMEPTEEDWEHLLDAVQRNYQRGKAKREEVELVLKRKVARKRGEPSQRISKEL